MNVWIITTGSSDIQLTTDRHWNSLCDRAKNQQESDKKLDFDKKIDLTKSVVKPKGIDRAITRFLAPARAMGIVYANAIAQKPEYYNDLDFPLLNNFSVMLQQKQIVFNRIIVFVTDQSHLFARAEKNQIYSPHWQDTRTLKEILDRYFENFTHKVAGTTPEYLELKPEPNNSNATSNQISGLDDWNDVLKLVQKKFAELQDIPEDANIYVSHQAGTPAISSAVQFASLARFRNNVEFLVSNEYNAQLTRTIEKSSYLRGIQMQEAKRLLESRHYGGVQQLLQPYLLKERPLDKRIQSLLAIAIQWNFAEFDDFRNKLQEYHNEYNSILTDVEAKQFQHWWWVGYEAAYLAVVRLKKQKNTVEALFHSFRSVEGIIAEWAKATYQNYITDRGQSLLLHPEIRQVLPNYLDSHKPSVLKPKVLDELKDKLVAGKLYLYSASLYELLRVSKPQWQQNEDIAIVWDVAAKRRNERFHQILGMKELEVCDAWNTNNSQQWEQRILGCLNFVSDCQFSSLKEASLMTKVHQELVEAIAHYELQT